MFGVENAPVVPLLDHADSGRVRGSVIQLHLEWLRDFGSRDEIIELFESLHPALRHQVLAAQPAAWYRFGTVAGLQIAMAAYFAGGDSRFLERIGAYAAVKQLGPLHEYLDASRLHDFFRTAAVLHHDALDFGCSDYEALTERSGRMLVSGLAGTPSYRAFLAGYYREAVAQHGCGATVRESCSGIFEMEWR